MYRKRLLLLLLSIYLFETGCTFLVGKVIYDSGELIRIYPATYEESVSASAATLESLNLRINNNISSGITTKIEAEWSDGTPVMVMVKMMGVRFTEVSVRSGVVGVVDKKACRMIHDSIAKDLGL